MNNKKIKYTGKSSLGMGVEHGEEYEVAFRKGKNMLIIKNMFDKQTVLFSHEVEEI